MDVIGRLKKKWPLVWRKTAEDNLKWFVSEHTEQSDERVWRAQAGADAIVRRCTKVSLTNRGNYHVLVEIDPVLLNRGRISGDEKAVVCSIIARRVEDILRRACFIVPHEDGAWQWEPGSQIREIRESLDERPYR